MSTTKHPEVSVQLTGEDGNAFAIIGRVSKALRRAGINPKEFQQQAMAAASYDDLLMVAMEWVDAS